MAVVGAIISSDFASENSEYTDGSRRFYWTEATRKKKTGRQKVHSSDGHTYRISKQMKNEVCYYRCKRSDSDLCTGSLVIDPKENGKVKDNVNHKCKPNKNVVCEGEKVGY